jgi:NDP-sugar pyrophosphorylase family protein
MLGIVLAAGAGSRMGTFCRNTSKCLLPVGSETLLARVIRQIAEAGAVREIVVIVRSGERNIPAAIGNRCGAVPVRFCEQKPWAAGPVGAAYSAGVPGECGETVLIALGDEYYDGLLFSDFIREHERSGFAVSAALYRAESSEQIRKNYTAALTKDFRILRAVEKPVEPLSPFAGCGAMLISGPYFREFHERHSGGLSGCEMVSWINEAVESGLGCHGFVFSGRYRNVNTVVDYLTVCRMENEKAVSAAE